MNTFKRSVCILLVLIMALTLCACGGTSAAPKPAAAPEAAAAPEPAAAGLEELAGEYSFLCARFSAAYMDRTYELGGVNDIPDQYVDIPEMAGETVTLKADGTGSLYWGADNQGPIDWWKMDGDALQFQAGVAVIDGTIVDGLMTLRFDEGFDVCFALPGADTSGIAPISLDSFASMLREEPAPELPVEGTYEMFAVENEGDLVYSGDLEMASTITLAAGGTGHMTSDEDAMDIAVWTAEGERISITMADGGTADGKLLNGVIELDLYGDGSMILYFAQEGADLSGYAPMTLEEYRAKHNS